MLYNGYTHGASQHVFRCTSMPRPQGPVEKVFKQDEEACLGIMICKATWDHLRLKGYRYMV